MTEAAATHPGGAASGHAAGLAFERIQFGGSRLEHGTGGDGPPVVFLHGWGIGPRSYAGTLNRLVEIGCRILAPALPGFGGTPALEGEQCSFAGYADWLAGYLDATGCAERAMVVGHSFGGGVAVQLAHDHPERVRAVVACNGIGGEGGPGPTDRPWWEWGRDLGSDLFALGCAARVLPAVIGQAVPNIVQNPFAMWRVGEIVRRADLRREVRVVRRRGMSVTIVWSDRDRLVSHSGFVSMCRSAGIEGIVVPGHHSWLIADPDRFAEVMLRALVDAGVVEESLLTSASA